MFFIPTKQDIRRKSASYSLARLLVFYGAVLLGCIFGVTPGRSAQGLVASGYQRVTTIGASGLVTPSGCSTNQFRASVAADGRWKLEIRPIHQSEDVIYLAFDGSDTYSVRYRKDLRAGAYISRGNYPFGGQDDQYRGNILWLVFGAGQKLRDGSNLTMPLPWRPARVSPLAYGFRIESKLLSDPPYVPQQLRFVRDYKLDLPTLANEFERPELDSLEDDETIKRWKNDIRSRKTDWTNGFLAGELRCVDFTNRNDLTIPLSFSFDAFDPAWQDAPPFSPNAVTNWELFAAKMKQPAPEDLVSQHLSSRLSTETKNLLSSYSGVARNELKQALCNDLETIVQSGPLYDAKRFVNVKLTKEVEGAARDNRYTGRMLVRVNRMLLYLAYPTEIAKPRLSQKIPRYSHFGIVTNVTDLSAEEAFLPPIFGNVSVADSRFRARDSLRALDEISYEVDKTKSWRSSNDSQLLAQFKAGLSIEVSHRRLPAVVLRKRLIMIGIFVVVAASLPLVFYLRRTRKKRISSF